MTPASLRITGDRASATFSMGGQKGSVSVDCAGPLPDNLADDVAVVVEGRLEQPGLLRGEKVMTRCASKYSPEGPGAPPERRPVVPGDGR